MFLPCFTSYSRLLLLDLLVLEYFRMMTMTMTAVLCMEIKTIMSNHADRRERMEMVKAMEMSRGMMMMMLMLRMRVTSMTMVMRMKMTTMMTMMTI